MKIRSVTYFDNPGNPILDDFLKQAEFFFKEARTRFQAAGLDPQTLRFASPPFPLFLEGLRSDEIVEYARNLERSLAELGFEYLSLGPALPQKLESFPVIPEIIENTEKTFCSGLLTHPGKGLSLPAVRACGRIIHQLTPLDPDGFANLYFAALGNVPAGGPFFPAAYHDNSGRKFAVAVEGADLAVEAFSSSRSFQEARQKLIQLMEKHGKNLESISTDLADCCRVQFGGIDYSLAPFPEGDRSIGRALEETGLKAIGDLGSLAAAAFLADTIDRAEFRRTGFSGLMLPVLEDSVLARRGAEGKLGVKDMLLFSSVCGTGLDTVPLPGDASQEQLSAILFDLGALSLRLDKPLTARLMPIPGKKAGESTTFDFPYFANSKVLDLQAEGLGNFFKGDGYLDIRKR
jgi:uncharacterized protein (UPF0210 family)